MTRFRFPLPRTLVLGNALLIGALAVLLPSEVPDWEVILAQSARAAFSLMVAVVYAEGLYDLCCRQKQQKTPNPAHLVIMAVFLWSSSEFFMAVQAILWRWVGKPEDWTTSGWWIFAPIVTAIAAMHLVASPGSIDGRVPKRAMIATGVGIGLTFMVFGFVLGLTYRATSTL